MKSHHSLVTIFILFFNLSLIQTILSCGGNGGVSVKQDENIAVNQDESGTTNLTQENSEYGEFELSIKMQEPNDNTSNAADKVEKLVIKIVRENKTALPDVEWNYKDKYNKQDDVFKGSVKLEIGKYTLSVLAHSKDGKTIAEKSEEIVVEANKVLKIGLDLIINKDAGIIDYLPYGAVEVVAGFNDSPVEISINKEEIEIVKTRTPENIRANIIKFKADAISIKHGDEQQCGNDKNTQKMVLEASYFFDNNNGAQTKMGDTNLSTINGDFCNIEMLFPSSLIGQHSHLYVKFNVKNKTGDTVASITIKFTQSTTLFDVI